MTPTQSAQSKLTADATRSLLNGLRDMGLTTYESQAYLSLIRTPNISATQLCNDAGIPDSKIYFALEELQKKGLILVSDGVPRHYRALPPKEGLRKLKSLISEEYEAQIERLNQLTTALQPLYAHVEDRDIELAYVVKGFDNVLSKMLEVVRGAKREVVAFIPDKDIYDRMERHLSNLRNTGVKVKLAVPARIRKQVDQARFSEVRETSPGCENCWLVVVDNKTVVSSSQWTPERGYAILTQDPVLVAMSREYFESPRCCVIA